jgi:hypothetical protein
MEDKTRQDEILTECAVPPRSGNEVTRSLSDVANTGLHAGFGTLVALGVKDVYEKTKESLSGPKDKEPKDEK